MADPELLNIFRLCDRLHKTPDEIRTMTVADFEAFCVYTRMEADR